MKERRIAGEARVVFTAYLPAETAYEKVASDDPAVEAVLEALYGDTKIYLWGQEKEPAHVTIEVFEEDIDVEEDEEVE